MRTVSRLLFLSLLVVSVVVGSAPAAPAAEGDSLRSWSSQPLQDFGNRTSTPMTRDDQMIKALEERELQQELRPLADTDLQDAQDDQTGKGKDSLARQKSKKPAVVVKGEPGDGLVKLSWKLSNLRPRIDDEPLRFTIRYGTESGKLAKERHGGDRDRFCPEGTEKLPALFHPGDCPRPGTAGTLQIR